MLRKIFKKGETEAGCDEAGRGCLAGPVFAAAVILPDKFFHPLLNDSKLMREEDRYLLRPIIEKKAVGFAVAHVDTVMIDKINILNAAILAMHMALEQLIIKPTLILVDGNRFKCYNTITHHCIIKGDSKYASIAAASVLAKTYRDDYMKQLHSRFHPYNWKQNKGYATEEHRSRIQLCGITEHHRKSFRLQYSGEMVDGMFD